MGRRTFTAGCEPLSYAQYSALVIGPSDPPAFASEADRAAAWEANAERLVGQVARNPGHRPWAWWHYVAEREEWLNEPDPRDPDAGTRFDDCEAESIGFLAGIGELSRQERRELRRLGREAQTRIGTAAEQYAVDADGTVYGPDRLAVKIMGAIDGATGRSPYRLDGPLVGL